MNITPVMITCPARNEVCEQTMRRFRNTDWPRKEHILNCYMDTSKAERPQERQEQNALNALKHCLHIGAEHILFLEDDLEFNDHLYHNLCEWEPLKMGWVGMASLYNPTIQELSRNSEKHWFIANPNAVYGSQAYVISRVCAEFMVLNWAKVPGMQDIKMSRLAAEAGFSIFYHTPSLVQHVGTVSAWGTDYFHQTQDFDKTFKA